MQTRPCVTRRVDDVQADVLASLTASCSRRNGSPSLGCIGGEMSNPWTRWQPVSARSDLGLGIKHITARLSYNRTDAQVVQVAATRTVVFVHPLYPVAGALMLLVGLGFALRARSRRHRPLRQRQRRQRAAQRLATDAPKASPDALRPPTPVGA